jgi:uncharacterized membrane-anchored protein YhcB (DUF1043 family)
MIIILTYSADRQLLLEKKEQNRTKKEELERAQSEIQNRREEYKKHYSTQLTRLEELKSEFMAELVNCRRYDKT